MTDNGTPPATSIFVLPVTVTNTPPVAVVAGGDRMIHAGDDLVLDASSSFDPDTAAAGDTITSYSWFLNGQTTPLLATTNSQSTIPWPTLFAAGGTVGQFTLTLQVTDNLGANSTNAANFQLNVLDHPPVAGVVEGNRSINMGDSLILDGSISTDPDIATCGDSILQYSWKIDNVATPLLVTSNPTATVTWATLSALGIGAGPHTVSLTTTDSFGLTSMNTASFQLNVAPTLDVGGVPDPMH